MELSYLQKTERKYEMSLIVSIRVSTGGIPVLIGHCYPQMNPWKDAYRKGAHSEITKEAIRTYFNNKEVDYVYGIRYSELVHRIQ